MAIAIRCATCGKGWSAPIEAAGKAIKCPSCSNQIQVPSHASHSPVAAIRRPGSVVPTTLESPSINVDGSRRQSITISQILLWMLVAWAIVVAIVFAVGMSILSTWLAVTTLILITIGFLFTAANLFVAKKKALKYGSANALFGLVQIVAWDPTEGVLFLKDKMLDYVDSNPNDGGGIRIVLPFHGEEEVCRVPLEVQTTEYSDDNVTTREYVPLKMTGAIFWRIVDVARFYLLVSREMHKVDDRGGHQVSQPKAETSERARLRSGSEHQLEVAEEWLRLIAEEQTRSVVAQVHTGLLVAEQVAAALPPGLRELITPIAKQELADTAGHITQTPASGKSFSPSSSRSYRSAADALGDAIRNAMEAVVPEYGIHVDRVSLQEARLPAGILDAAAAACSTAYQPLTAQRQAAADTMKYAAEAEKRRMYLGGEADVIGKDAVAQKEVLGRIQPFALGGRGFLQVLGTVFDELKQGDRDK